MSLQESMKTKKVQKNGSSICSCFKRLKTLRRVLPLFNPAPFFEFRKQRAVPKKDEAAANNQP